MFSWKIRTSREQRKKRKVLKEISKKAKEISKQEKN
jgi:hypothetical protein